MPDDVAGALTAKFSIIGVDTGATITNNVGNQIGTAASPVDPLLVALADNGGPTLTHALGDGSPAIDAGDPAAMSGMGDVPLNDQRGAPFARVEDGDGAGGARIDIGSVEAQPIPPAVFGDYNLDNSVDAADYVLWRNTLGTNVPQFSGADGSGNGVVDQDDYVVWRAHFGLSLSASSRGRRCRVDTQPAANPDS